MQLLDSEQLEYAFQLHGITLETQARRFYGDVWKTIQDAEKASDGAGLAAQERHLRHLCQSYFMLVRDWRLEQEDRMETAESCSSSRDNAREASGALPLFEKQFFRYTLCYMELNRALIRARAKISHFAKDHNIEEYGKGMDVNHGTGAMLMRAHRELAMLQQKVSNFERMRTLLQASDPLMEELGDGLPKVMNTEGDRQLTLFKGALRRCEFDRAEQLASAWKDEHLRATGRIVTAIVKQNMPHLKVHEGIVLHSGELSLPYSMLKGDEKKARDFLEKYNIPYMVFQYKALIRLGYLLGKIGSIEGLIIQHAKLASLSVRLHNDGDYAKTQQQSVLLPARVLLESRFTSLTAIFNDMETILATLEKLLSQTREYQAHTKA